MTAQREPGAPAYCFTADHVSGHVAEWQRLTADFAGRPVTMIEIGSYEGRSAIWWLDHVCTHPDSRLYCIDPGGDPECFRRLLGNLSAHPRGHQVTLLREPSRLALPRFPDGSVDVAYVDGSHEARDVLLDALLLFHVTRSDALIIFDDYGWDDPKKLCQVPPKPGLDAWLVVAGGLLTVVHKEHQLAVRKR